MPPTPPHARRNHIDQLVADNLRIVAHLARQVYLETGKRFELEELVAVGNQGLVEAATRFRDDGGASFATFAYYRVRGAMYDSLRRHGGLPRKSRRGPSTCPGAEHLPRRPLVGELFELPTVEEDLDRHHATARLRSAMKRLPTRERRLVERHYFDELPLSDAGRELGVSKSWASRMHSRAVGRLRATIDRAAA